MSDVAPSGPRIISLCTGIGGLELGVKSAFPGSRAVCLVEREAACVEILANRMEEGALDKAPCWSDVRTFDGKPWRGAVDIITAGYPCQPFSQAGKGLAEKDPRHIWPDVSRIIQEVQPRVVVLENVQGHINRGLKQVLEEMASMGFDAEWGVYSAAQVGAPHRRNRVFVVAYCRRRGFPGEWATLYDHWSDALRNDPDGPDPAVADAQRAGLAGRGTSGDLARPARDAEGEGLQLQRSGDSPDDRVSPVADSGRQGLQGGQQREALHGDRDGQKAHGPAPELCGALLHEWPPGPDEEWGAVPEEFYPSLEPDFRGMANGVPARMDRLRALGNAVVPAQAQYAITDLIHRITS